jgi:hypothetical protein
VAQREGDISFKGAFSAICKISDSIGVKTIVKEVGNGISKEVAKRFAGTSVYGIDTGGAGGTNWVAIELYRAGNAHLYKHIFREWGIPTAQSLIEARSEFKRMLTATGGIRSASDIAKAVALGADAAVDAMDPNVVGSVRAALGESADVVFDCVATESTVTDAIAIADKGGTVVIVGVPAGKVTIPLPMIQDHQLRIQGSATYLPEDFAESIDILRRGIVRAADIVTAIRPMELAAEAFALSASGHHIKVLVSI